MNTDHANPALFAALAKAQGEIENASKNAANPHFRSKYADLAEVLNTIREPFAKHGLSLMQSTEFDGATVSVVTLVGHADGGFITARASCVPAKTDAQGVGAATTYLRRYSAAAVAGIAQEDDDGTAAAHNRKPKPVQKTSPTAGVWESTDPEEQAFLLKVAAKVSGMADAAEALAYIESQRLDNDQTTALWTRLDSGTRSALKQAKAARDALAADRADLDAVA